MTKERYFSNFEKCLSIFGHRLECTKPESIRLQNMGVDSGLRLPDCDTGYVDELNLRCLTAVCTDIKHSVIDKAVDEWQCPLPRDDTLNTSFAEYLAFSLIFLFFFTGAP